MKTFIVLRNNNYTRIDVVLCDSIYWWAFHGESSIHKIRGSETCGTYVDAIYLLCQGNTALSWKLIGLEV